MLKITSLAFITFMIAPLHAGMLGSDKTADSQKNGVGFDLATIKTEYGGARPNISATFKLVVPKK